MNFTKVKNQINKWRGKMPNVVNVNNNYPKLERWGKEEKETCVLLKKQYGIDYETIQKILNEKYGNNRTIDSIRTRLSMAKKKLRNIKLLKDNGKENILHTAIEFLEKKKEGKSKKEINMIAEWQNKTSTLGKVIENGFNEMFESRNKPIRKTWYFHITDKEENINIINIKLNAWIDEMEILFPESKITLSNCKDVLTRNDKGQFKIT